MCDVGIPVRVPRVPQYMCMGKCFYYSGPSEGSPSYKMEILFYYYYFLFISWSRNEEKMRRMKKECDVFDRIEFQDFSADKGKQTTQDSSRLES